MQILRLDKSGMPLDWLTPQHAARYYTQGKVLFELGQCHQTLYGGWNHLGLRSQLRMSSIIACAGNVVPQNGNVALCNTFLFRRDNYLCLYCGDLFRSALLTRDHIIPRSRGGQNTWTNSATSCARCNHKKGARTPEEAGMTLLAVPFQPNRYERFFLMNRTILADQMEFLASHFSAHRDWGKYQ